MKRPSLDSILLASTDPRRHGNYVQIIQLSPAHRAAMESR